MTLLNMMRGGGSHSLVPSGKQHCSILALLACAALFLCVFALPAKANAYEYDEVKQGSLTFRVFDDHAEVWGYDGTESNLDIPSAIAGKPVTSIQLYFNIDSDFGDKLESVHIPGSIKTLGAIGGSGAITGPFAGCQNLRSVILDEGIEKIGNRVFARTAITSITLPNSLTFLGLGTFEGSALESISFPAGLDEIPADVCQACTSLRTVTIPEGIVSIGSQRTNSGMYQSGFSFSGCTSLESVTIPSTVRFLANGVFLGCSNLKTVELLSSKLSDWFAMNAHSYGGVYNSGPFIDLAKGSVIYVQNDDVFNKVNSDKWITPSLSKVVNRNAKPLPAPTPTPVKKSEMFRLYNPNSGEHFYTSNTGERDHLKSVGWTDEGKGWNAPVKSNTPVYRLYNPYAGEHHYAMSKNERDELVRIGWTDEGIGWYSDDARGVKLYRLYNPNAYSNNHHYTLSANEHDTLVAMGWRDEGAAWYGCKG